MASRNSTKKNRALLHKAQEKIFDGDVAPKIQTGITQGVSAKELAEDYRDHKRPDGHRAMQHMNTETPSAVRGVPRPHFVGRDRTPEQGGIVRQREDGSKLGDVELTFTADVLNAMRQGMICLKCLEPQSLPWGDMHVPGCEGVLIRGGNYMRDWQIIDLAMEFQGETHLGPAQPIAEAMAEQEERALKAAHAKRIAEGGSRGRRGVRAS